MSSLSVSDIFGDYNTVAFGIWPKSWKCNGMVNPNTFLYLPAMIASIGLGIAMLIAILNLAKRVYEIVFLYIVMPMSMSTLCIDDGARFKIWRETLITKILLAYGAVFSVNIFVLLLPIISNMRIEGMGGFGNSLFLIFMILGGATVIPAGQMMFARLFGQADDVHMNGGFLRTAFYGGRVASAMTMHTAMRMMKGTVRTTRAISRHHADKKAKKAAKADSDDKYTEEKQAKSDTKDQGGNKA